MPLLIFSVKPGDCGTGHFMVPGFMCDDSNPCPSKSSCKEVKKGDKIANVCCAADADKGSFTEEGKYWADHSHSCTPDKEILDLTLG